MKAKFIATNIDNNDILWGDNTNPIEILKLNKIYDVKSIEEFQFYTRVYLYNIDGYFNGVWFEIYNETELDDKYNLIYKKFLNEDLIYLYETLLYKFFELKVFNKKDVYQSNKTKKELLDMLADICKIHFKFKIEKKEEN